MRKIVNIIFVALCSVALFSCTKESSLDGEGKISFTITTDPLIETKAFPESDNALRENQINRIDYFIYKNGDYSQAALSGRLDTDAVHEKKFIVDVAGVDYNDLVSAGAPLLYAVVNLPENVRIPATASLEAVKNSVVVANFLRDTQNGFLMSGEMALTLNAAGADCHIVVERVAAKVSFNITTDEFVYEDEADPTSTKWYSHPEAMKVEFMNLGSQAIVKGEVSSVSNTGVFSYPEETLRNQYYTYPREWDYGMDDEPYVFITLPVTKGSFDGERRDCYYKAVFTNKSFESNHWYKYTLSLKMLGSFEREVPQVPTPEDAVFFVYQWGGKHGYDGNATEGQITGFRYLMVEENSPTKVYYMYNQNSIQIPFSTSHDCQIINVSAKSEYFIDSSGNGVHGVYKNRASQVSVSLVDGRIVVTHNLVNNMSASNYDYSPIDITFTIKHNTGDSQDDRYSQNITIRQYPAMYISADKNNGGNVVSDSGTTNDDKGFVFVYGNQLSTVSDQWLKVRSCEDGGNHNPYMYVITTSTMDPSLNLVLADPRGTAVTGSSLGLTKVDAYGNTLGNYLPTITDDASKDYVSPSFRMASSYGKCSGNMNKSGAIKRCASYQEQGRPAGRWRLPTYGELRYVQILSSKKIIPQLYSTDNYYWTANGPVQYNSNPVISTSSSQTAVVRCVYDEWYWTNTATPTVDKTKFTWTTE